MKFKAKEDILICNMFMFITMQSSNIILNAFYEKKGNKGKSAWDATKSQWALVYINHLARWLALASMLGVGTRFLPRNLLGR